MATSFALSIRLPEGPVQERIVNTGTFTLGREPDCDIVIESEHVSRHHARLILGEKDFQVVDLGSTAGTTVNSKPVVMPLPVPYPGVLDLGSVNIRVDFADGASPKAASLANPDAPVPFVFGKRIAQGGMGAILEAQDCKIGRTIAVKLMLSELNSDADQMQRFINEAAVLGRLEHPNIVPIHDLGRTSGGELFYTMKLVKGRTLKDILNAIRDGDAETTRQYTPDRLLTVFRKVCDAMAFSHAHGIIHRDLKPENIMVGEFGEVLVMDWGLAKILNPGSAPASPLSMQLTAEQQADFETGTINPGMTMEGDVMGTPQYMSPEQASGRIAEMDARSDIFSLGGILYTILTLRPPVVGRGFNEILRNVATGVITSPTVFGSAAAKTMAKPKGSRGQDPEPGTPLPHMPGGRVPAALCSVVMKALSVEREKRYQNVVEFSADIEKYQGGFATSAENAGVWKQLTLLVKRNKAAAIGLAAVVLIGGTFGTQAVVEGRRAERMLGELRGTAPTFAEQTRALIGDADFAGALQKIDYAVKLAPGEAEHHVLRGHILQSLFRFADAEAAYREALARDPAHRVAAENAELSHTLAAQLKDGVLPRAGYDALLGAMKAQGRTGEAGLIAAHLGGASKEALEKWRPIITREFRGLQTQLRPDEGGRLYLELSDARDKTALLTDISALKGMPLRTLWLGDNSALKDITPLAGLPIEEIRMRYSSITDLSPLKGMPLRKVNWNYSGRLSDLSPLAGAPLESLDINMCLVTNLAPLKGAPLQRLDISRTLVVDLSPLAGAPLEWLLIRGTRVSDLRPLAGMPLKDLHIGATPVTDLSPLAGTKLEIFQADYNASLTDISALRGLPLRELMIQGTSVADLSVLADCKTLQYLSLPVSQRAKLDLSPIRRLPKLEWIAFTDREIARDKFPTAAEFWKEYDAWKAEEKK